MEAETKKIFNKLFKEEKIELATQKVDLSLMNDVDKELDKAMNKMRNLIKIAKKVSDDFNQLQTDFSNAMMIAKKGENAAKDIGAEDVRKFFGARGDEAKDYLNQVGKAANGIFSAVSSI